MGRARDDRSLEEIELVGPVCLRSQLEETGLSRAAYHRLLQRGELRRLTRTAFVTERQWEVADPWTRFRWRSLAVGSSGPSDLHLTGWAAAIVHDLPVLGAPPGLPTGLMSGDPHVGAQRTPYFRYRRGWLPEHRQTHVGGVRVVDRALTAVDVARHFGRQAGLMVSDRALSEGTDAEDLIAVCDNMRKYPGINDARWCAEHADARSESPAETLGRWAFLTQGRAAPLSNVWFWRDGYRYRADLFLPDQGVILEADGAVKYDNRSDASKVVRDQVEREERLRSWNVGLVRYGFADPLRDPAALVRRTDRAALLRPDQPLLCRWSLNPPWHQGP